MGHQLALHKELCMFRLTDFLAHTVVNAGIDFSF